MRLGNEQLPEQSVYPSGGLNTRDPSTLVDPRFTPDILNVTLYKGLPKKRRGYSQLGDDLDGTVMAVIKFEVGSGVVKTVAITTTKQYVLVSGSWTNITYQSGGVDVDWTGDTNDTIDWVVGTDDNGTWLIVTNGVDEPRRWDGSTPKFELSGINLVGFTSCRCLEIAYGSLVLGNLNTDEEKVVAWSDTSNFFEFTTGNADAQLMGDGDGPIQRLVRLGDRVVVYHQNSIGIVTYVGGSVVYQSEQLIQETRLLSPRAIVNIGPFHLFASKENVFAFDGTRQLAPMGELFASKYREDLLIDEATKTLLFYDSIETQVLCYVPRSATSGTIYILELELGNLGNIRPTRIDFNDSPGCFGYLRRDDTLLYNSTELSGLSYADLAFKYNDVNIKAGYPMVVFGSGSSTFLWNGTVYGDDGNTVNSYIDTIDFTVPQEYISSFGRWVEIEIELRGSEVEVLYSTDLGESFTAVGAGEADYVNGVQTLTSLWTRYRFFVDTVAQTFRVRVRNNTTTGWFERKFLRVWVSEAGAY